MSYLLIYATGDENSFTSSRVDDPNSSVSVDRKVGKETPIPLGVSQYENLLKNFVKWVVALLEHKCDLHHTIYITSTITREIGKSFDENVILSRIHYFLYTQ